MHDIRTTHDRSSNGYNRIHHWTSEVVSCRVVISRPDVLLVDATTPHTLHYLLGFLLRHAALLLDDLREDLVDFARHVCRVTADVEICLFQEQVVDELAVGF